MIIDDRLLTVLATPATGTAAARTQWQQLLDLLDRIPPRTTDDPDHGDAAQAESAALDRLDSLEPLIPESVRERMVRAAALRSPWLVAHLAGRAPRVAAAAIAGARLTDAQWAALIPHLPLAARGFLRHRRDVGPEAGALLARLGIGDMALPLPPEAEPLVLSTTPPPAPIKVAEPAPVGEIGAIVRRIEEYRRQRESENAEATSADPATAPLPPRALPVSLDCQIDASGEVIWSDGPQAAGLIGHRPFTADPLGPARCDATTLAAARDRRPVIAGRVWLDGAPDLAGAWRIDAAPRFARPAGHFLGWHARLRRPLPDLTPAEAAPATASVPPVPLFANDDPLAGLPVPPPPQPSPLPADPASGEDRLRQMLHELKTPINAIQGFAELIQQQVLGDVPHHYRGYAAAIATDAARMLADFEALDRLARLESGREAPEAGTADARALVPPLADRLEPLFARHGAALAVQPGDDPLPVALAPSALEALAWRLLGAAAGSAGSGERLTLRLGRSGNAVRLALKLPAALDEAAPEILPPGPDRDAAPSLLGPGFALRTVAAEVRAAGGTVRRSASFMTCDLPLAAGPG